MLRSAGLCPMISSSIVGAEPNLVYTRLIPPLSGNSVQSAEFPLPEFDSRAISDLRQPLIQYDLPPRWLRRRPPFSGGPAWRRRRPVSPAGRPAARIELKETRSAPLTFSSVR